jgi:uncharacterized tellurite resistance protein B-like protein
MEREATIDLLIWTMYADNLLALPETEKLDQITQEIPWDSPTRPDQYINSAFSRVRDVVADSTLADGFLADVSRRLGSRKARTQAYELCRELAQSDGQVAERETQLLKRIRAEFGIEE